MVIATRVIFSKNERNRLATQLEQQGKPELARALRRGESLRADSPERGQFSEFFGQTPEQIRSAQKQEQLKASESPALQESQRRAFIREEQRQKEVKQQPPLLTVAPEGTRALDISRPTPLISEPISRERPEVLEQLRRRQSIPRKDETFTVAPEGTRALDASRPTVLTGREPRDILTSPQDVMSIQRQAPLPTGLVGKKEVIPEQIKFGSAQGQIRFFQEFARGAKSGAETAFNILTGKKPKPLTKEETQGGLGRAFQKAIERKPTTGGLILGNVFLPESKGEEEPFKFTERELAFTEETFKKAEEIRVGKTFGFPDLEPKKGEGLFLEIGKGVGRGLTGISAGVFTGLRFGEFAINLPTERRRSFFKEILKPQRLEETKELVIKSTGKSFEEAPLGTIAELGTGVVLGLGARVPIKGTGIATTIAKTTPKVVRGKPKFGLVLEKPTFETRGKVTVTTTTGEVRTQPTQIKPSGKKVADILILETGRQAPTFLLRETLRDGLVFTRIPRERGSVGTALIAIRTVGRDKRTATFLSAGRAGLTERPRIISETETPRGLSIIERGKVEADVGVVRLKKKTSPKRLRELQVFKEGKFTSLKDIKGIKFEKFRGISTRRTTKLKEPKQITRERDVLSIREFAEETTVGVGERERIVSVSRATGFLTKIERKPSPISKPSGKPSKPIFERPDEAEALGTFMRITEPEDITPSGLSLRSDSQPIAGLGAIGQRGARLALREFEDELTFTPTPRDISLPAPQVTRVALGTGLRLSTRVRERLGEKVKEKLDLREKSVTDTIQKTPTTTRDITDTGTIQTSSLKLDQLTETVQEEDLTRPFPPTLKLTSGQRRGLFPLGRRPSKPRPQPKKTGQGFIPQARVKGKFIDLIDEPIERSEAVKLGAHVTDETALASFRIRKSLKPTTDTRAKGTFRSDKFRSSKKQPNILIEKNKFRIDSPREKEQITEKGLRTLARRRLLTRVVKRKSGRSSLSGLGRLKL